MRNLKKFLYNSEYDFYINGDYVKLPNISYIEEIMSVRYNPILSREAYFSIPKEVEAILPYSISIPNAIKSFKVNNVEYVKSTDSVNTINVEGGIFVDDVLNFITQHPEYNMVGDAFSSIILTIPDFNPTTEDIVLIQYIEFGDDFDCVGLPISLAFPGLLSPISENKYEIHELFFVDINNVLEQSAQLGYTVKFYLTATESGYTFNEDSTLASFTTKPTTIEYKTDVDKFTFNEVGNYTAEIEFHDKNILSISFMGWPVMSFNDIFFKGLSINNALSLFYSCSLMDSINIENLDTSLTTNTSYMFSECTNLKTIKGIENLSVDNVTNMEGMFSYCTSLTSLDLSNWNTSNVTGMNGMFESCTSLTSVKMGGDISNVTNVENIFISIETSGKFYYNSTYDYSIIINELPETWKAIPCTMIDGKLIPDIDREIYLSLPEESVDTLPLSLPISDVFKSFKINDIEYVQESEGEDENKTITINQSGRINDLLNFLLGNEEYAMTEDAYSYIKVTLSDFSATNGDEVLLVLLIEMDGEIICEPTPGIAAGLALPKSENIIEISAGTISLINQYASEIQAAGGNLTLFILGMGSDFVLDEDGYYISSFTLKPTTIEYKGGSLSIWTIVEPGDYTAQVEFKSNDVSGLVFQQWPIIGFSDEFFTGLTTKNASMLFYTPLLLEVEMDGFITSDTTNTAYMFLFNDSLMRISGMDTWNTSNVTNMSYMFSGCRNLTSLASIKDWDTSKVTDMTYMFQVCYGLTSLDLSNWDTGNVTNMNNMFYGCYGLTSLDSIKDWDVNNVTDMNNMFYYCSGLTSLDLSNWDTSNVTDMSNMFQRCINLTEIRMGGDVNKVTNMSGMFGNVASGGTFYYNSAHDYSKITALLPSTWTSVPCTLNDGILIPNN